MTDQLIITKADKLAKYVNSKGRVEVTYAAKHLGLDLEKAKEWAKILNSHGMISIQYSPLHGMILVSKKVQKKKTKEKSKSKR